MEEIVKFEERTISIKRVARTVKGGKKPRMLVCSAVGDCESRVGIGLGKAQEIVDAVRKASDKAKKNLIAVKRRGTTIPHRVSGKCGGAKILIIPAAPGTGIVACDTVRNVLELGGVKDVLTKSLGSSNAGNLAKATINALLKLRTREEVSKMRGVWLKE